MAKSAQRNQTLVYAHTYPLHLFIVKKQKKIKVIINPQFHTYIKSKYADGNNSVEKVWALLYIKDGMNGGKDPGEVLTWSPVSIPFRLPITPVHMCATDTSLDDNMRS